MFPIDLYVSNRQFFQCFQTMFPDKHECSHNDLTTPCEPFSNSSFLGDLEQLVSPDPEVTCIERDEQDNYMMVACDGIYDVMSNEEIVEFINDRFTREENEGNICNNLLDLCLYKVSFEFVRSRVRIS